MSTNSQAVRPIAKKLEGIAPRAWEHPADRAALATMQAIPGFDEVLKKLFSIFGERGARLAFQANSVRVSAKQFPRLHKLWLDVHDILDADQEYELYVSQAPQVNAGAFGLEKPWVVLLSGSLRTLSDDEVGFIMGHELGHVLSGHALYHTMLVMLTRIAQGGLPVLQLATTPIVLGLLEWYRKSEISCDRAGLLAVQQPDAGMSTMMRLAGGGTDEEMDLYEFLRQADEYRGGGAALDQLMKVLNTIYTTHPFLVLRAALLRDWLEEGAYDRILRGEYPRRGDAPPAWKDEATAGLRHYTGKVSGTAGKAGEAVRKAWEAFERGLKGDGEKGAGSGEDEGPGERG